MLHALTLLGTKGGPAIHPGGPNPTSMLLILCGRRIVIDCGLGVVLGLVETGLSLKELERVFITHLHSGHGLALGPLVHTVWTIGFDHPVTLYDPSGTRAVWTGFLASLAHDIETRSADEGRPDLAGLVHVIDHGPDVFLPVGDLTVAALRGDHPPVTECFALKFIGAGKTVVFSADTAPFPPLADFACGASVLVHEAMLPEGLESIVRRTVNGSRLREHPVTSHKLAADAAAQRRPMTRPSRKRAGALRFCPSSAVHLWSVATGSPFPCEQQIRPRRAARIG